MSERNSIALTGEEVAGLDLDLELTMEPLIQGAPTSTEALLYRDGNTVASVWRCEPGRYPRRKVRRNSSMYIIEGRATIVDADGTRRPIGPGSVLILPDGWVGEWDIHETIVKFYVHSFPDGETPLIDTAQVDTAQVDTAAAVSA